MVFFAYLMIEFIGVRTPETKIHVRSCQKPLRKFLCVSPFLWRCPLSHHGYHSVAWACIGWFSFFTVFELAGVKWAAALINFVVLTSAASALNSTLYSTGRHLYQIAPWFAKSIPKSDQGRYSSRHNVPQNAIIASAILIALAAFINVLPGVSDAFALITASSSGVYIAIYILIMVAHLKYRKSPDFMADGYLMPHYRFLNPFNHALLCLCLCNLFYKSLHL